MATNSVRETRRKWLANHALNKMEARYPCECMEELTFENEEEWLKHRNMTKREEVKYGEQQGTFLHINI